MPQQHTPTHALPYPEGADTADVPADLKALAEAVDAALAALDAGIPRAASGQKTIAAKNNVTAGALVGQVNVPEAGGRPIVCSLGSAPGGSQFLDPRASGGIIYVYYQGQVTINTPAIVVNWIAV